MVGIIAWLACYAQAPPDTPVELFIDSQTFGVKFLFAVLGTVIAAFWHAFFEGVAAAAPFLLMGRRPRPARQSALVSPATNVVSGIVAGVRQRNMLLLVVALMAAVAEVLLPALLANVPFVLTLTYDGHVDGTAGSMAILGVMVVVLLASLAVSWPHLPVDPRTLAGAIYYVAASPRLQEDARRLAFLPQASRDAEVEKMGRLYGYGPLALPDDPARMGVEVVDDESYRESSIGMRGADGYRLDELPRREDVTQVLLVGTESDLSGTESEDGEDAVFVPQAPVRHSA